MPIGTYCNAEILKAKNGERICLQESWRKSTYVIKRKCKLQVASPVFTFLCHSIYGHGSFDRLAEEWRAICVTEGLGKSAFSDKEVLLVELGVWDKEAYITEEQRKQEIAEAVARQAEQQRILQQAREKQIYEHKDILK